MRRSASYLVFLLCLAGLLSAKIHQGYFAQNEAHASGGVLLNAMGSAKEIVGDMMYLKADQYFHGGVEAEDFDEPCELKGAGSGAVSHAHKEHEHVHGPECEHSHGHEALPPPRNWIHAINRQIGVSEHKHLEAGDEGEIVPFLALANRLNTHHIDAILTTAYWLAHRLGKPDEAIRVLEQGMNDNAGDWRLDYNLAKIYLHHRKDGNKGNQFFTSAVKKSEADFPEALADRLALIEAMKYMAEFEMSSGHSAAALRLYEKIMTCFKPEEDIPLRGLLAERMREIAVISDAK